VDSEKSDTTPRIISLAPSATSIFCAIGAKHTRVGVTKWCADVALVADLPNLGDCWHLASVDELLKLEPTLVIGSVPCREEPVVKLLEHPVNFVAMNPRSLQDIETDIRMLGGIAESSSFTLLIKQMRKSLEQTARKARKIKTKVPVYCEAWPKPRISSPPLGQGVSRDLRQ
jgi:iron complex transport system substrate-binding protein